ncbi:MAG TPA: TIM barrel protein, partial [Dehalococcoidia bacterium]|nr:TIM barrel protein [Dehalococcoidia bacterium]
FAAEAGAGSVVVHLGGVGSAGVRGDSRLRGMFASGKRSGPEVEEARREAADERARRAPPALAAAARSLEAIAGHARGRGVRLGIETRMWYHEIPLPDEALSLLADYDPAEAGYWHDVGHAEILHRLGLVPREEWFAKLGGRVVGCHLHDMQGIIDHRAPGLGDVQWDYVARGVAPAPIRTLEINQHQPEPALTEALTLLRREGVLPA